MAVERSKSDNIAFGKLLLSARSNTSREGATAERFYRGAAVPLRSFVLTEAKDIGNVLT